MIRHNLHLIKPIVTTNSSSLIKTSLNRVSKVFYNKTSYLNELHILSLLEHPNIIKVKNNYEDEYNKGVIEFKYYKEGDLLTFINKHTRKKNTPITNQDRIDIFRTITHTLLYCHQNNIIHGDIKPQNFVIENNKPIIIDFGLSIYNENFTNNVEKNTVIRCGTQGSDGYMAPEVKGHFIGPCSDVYSLGIVLYQLFINEYPYFNNDMLELDCTTTHEHIPYKVCNLLHEMLEPDYKQRITVEEIIYDVNIDHL